MGVAQTLNEQPEFTVLGHIDDLEGIVPAVIEHHPDVLILDSHYQQGDEHLMAAVMKQHADCRVVVMVDHTDDECTVRKLLSGPKDRWPDQDTLRNLRECCLLAFRESAKGCVPKGSDPDRLLSALKAITAGEVWAGPGLSQYFVELVRPETGKDVPSSRLTKRELEVIGLMVEGLSNREVAGRLGLSEQTVKNHVARIMDKIDVRNRVELVLYAVRERLA
jgi:DNA-binding NarL/FixJ family response regulator